MFFADSICFENDSQFFDLSVLKITYLEDNFVLDQRAAVFVNKYNDQCFRVLVSCLRNNEQVQSVCYRLTTPKEEFMLNDRKIKLFSQLRLDYSISDTSFGVKEDSSLSFYDNIGYVEDQKERLYSIIKFIMNSDFVGCALPEVFSDLVTESISLPPSVSDLHYDPIFSV